MLKGFPREPLSGQEWAGRLRVLRDPEPSLKRGLGMLCHDPRQILKVLRRTLSALAHGWGFYVLQ